VINQPWTYPEINEAMRLFVKFDAAYCASLMNRSVKAIERMATKQGVKVAGRERSRAFYAENIAHIFELLEQGQETNDIAKCFNTTAQNIRSVVCIAKKHGFGKYPKRPESLTTNKNPERL